MQMSETALIRSGFVMIFISRLPGVVLNLFFFSFSSFSFVCFLFFGCCWLAAESFSDRTRAQQVAECPVSPTPRTESFGT